MEPNYQSILEQIEQDIQPYFGLGKTADYIPELAKVNPRQFGMCLVTVDGRFFRVGEAQAGFSSQSVSKLFTFVQALGHIGDELWQRVGNEPSGNTYNSLVQLENEEGIPRNPFINAGALVVSDILLAQSSNAHKELLDFIRKVCGNPEIDFDESVARSEIATGHRNAALAHFMKSFGSIRGDVYEVLRFYFYQCSIRMSCEDLAKSVLFLAKGGVNPFTDHAVLTPSMAKRTGALMLTTGLYNESGDFAYRVGIPAKSGVGGGIVGFVPNRFSVAVWSPELNARGNSLIGIEALERLTTYTGISIF